MLQANATDECITRMPMLRFMVACSTLQLNIGDESSAWTLVQLRVGDMPLNMNCNSAALNAEYEHIFN